MAPADPLTDDQVRRRRVAAQLLHRPKRSGPASLVRHLTGVQAQVLDAAALALRARAEGVTAEGVDRARLRRRSVVLTWAMRGTLHLISSADLGWLVPLTTEPRLSNARRRLRQLRVRSGDEERAARLIERALGQEGPLLRPDLAERLDRAGIRTEGQAIAHLMWFAAAGGAICRGPDRDGVQTYVLVRDWLGSAPEELERDAALAELAVRYLRAHAPATPTDLAAWSGLRARDATWAWRSISSKLVETPTRRGPMWSLRSSGADEPEDVVRLLPSFDELLLGWKDRGLVASPADWRWINRGGGWLRPVLLVDGRAAGTWGKGKDGAPAVRPFRAVAPKVLAAIAGETADVERFGG